MSDGLHHLQARKRGYKHLEKYPSSSTFKRWFDYLMFTVGTVAPVAVLPQVVQIYTTHNVAGLSLVTWASLGGVNVLWAIYGYLHRERPILIANTFMAGLNLVVVCGILAFR